MTLSRDQILGMDDLRFEIVPVPEWGDSVRIRTLSGAERDRFEESFVGKKGGTPETAFRNIRARFVCLIVVDDDGNRIFSDNDAPEIGKKSAAALDRIFSAGQKLNGMSPNDVDEMVKNSAAETSDTSTSS